MNRIVLTASLAGMFCNLIGQTLPNENQLIAYKNLCTKYPANSSVNWNESNGSPETINISESIAYYKDPINSANEFINEIKPLLQYNSKTDSLLLTKKTKHKNRIFLKYEQSYKGVQVKGGEYVLTMSQDGKIRTIMGSFYKDINVQTIPSISQNDALSIALKNPPINW